MRIGVIAPPWLAVPPSTYGGTESVLDAICTGLQRAGHHVTLATTGDSESQVPKTHLYRQALGIGPADASAELRHVLHAYEQCDGADIIHDHTLIGPILSKWFPRIPVVTTNHGPFTRELNAFFRLVGSEVPIIAISEHQASTARGIPIAAVVHHGLDVYEWPMGAGDGEYLLFLGRLHPDKGAHIAIEVARRAGIPLILAAKCSEPIEREYFRSQIEPALGNGIEFVGEVDRIEKMELLCGARGLINPISWAEPFGLVMLEALACGTPVVATPLGAAPEIIEDGRVGYLRADHGGLVGAVRSLDRIDRKACREHVARFFSRDRMVGRYVVAYGSIIRSRDHRRCSIDSLTPVDGAAVVELRGM